MSTSRPKISMGDLNKGLVLHTNLDSESYNSTTKRFTDKSAWANHGTSANAASLTTDHKGQINRAMMFNGSSDFINCGNNASLGITNAITISAWVYPTSVSVSQYILGKGANAGAGYEIEMHSNGNITFNIRKADNSTYVKTDVYNVSSLINTWFNVVGTYDGTTLRLYINATQQKTGSYVGTIYPSINNTDIGRRSIGGNFNGSIDEVRIYNRALSQNEITLLYNSYRLKIRL